jgi:phage head maturation protease
MSPTSGDCNSDNRSFAGVAYTGAVIERHGWMHNVIIDIATLSIEENLPLLIEHDTTQVIGTATASKVGNQIHTMGTLLNTIDPNALSVCQKAQAGIKWQLSVGIFDYSIRELNEDESDTVNGVVVSYPAVILRKGKLREVSVVALGADSATSIAIFSQANQTSKPTKQEDNRMEIKALQEENTALKAQLEATNAELSTLKAEFAAKQLEARTNDVKALFTALGREITDESIKPYLSMDSATFSIVAKDLQAMKPKADASLFAQQTQAQAKFQAQHQQSNGTEQAGSLLLSAVSQLSGV